MESSTIMGFTQRTRAWDRQEQLVSSAIQIITARTSRLCIGILHRQSLITRRRAICLMASMSALAAAPATPQNIFPRRNAIRSRAKIWSAHGLVFQRVALRATRISTRGASGQTVRNAIQQWIGRLRKLIRSNSITQRRVTR